MKNFKLLFFLIVIFSEITLSQNLILSSKENIYDKELNSIKRGKINNYLSLRYFYEWNNNKNKNNLLISKLGKKFLRNQRFKIFPEFNFKSTLNGGFIDNRNQFLDLLLEYFTDIEHYEKCAIIVKKKQSLEIMNENISKTNITGSKIR